MPAKQLCYDDAALSSLRKGVEILARAVRSTLGPKGKNVIIEKSFGAPTVTKDGVTVAKEITLEDPYENMGAQMVKEVASKTSDTAGDGTTTATVLAQAIFHEGLRYVGSGANVISIKRGIDKAVEAVTEELKKLKRDVAERQEIQHVATIAANNDPTIGKILADAMEKVGKDGVITVEEGRSTETSIEWVEGMQFDRGFISPYFVTKPETMECILESPLILVFEKKISSGRDFIPLLERVAGAGKPLLVIAEEVEGEALALLVVNKLKGVMNCCAVKAPGFGDRRKAMLQDIAVLTGGQAIFEDLGIPLAKLELRDLGSAERVVIDKDNTTIVNGKGKAEAIKGRIAQIKKEIETTTSDYDREKLQERLAKLSGGVAQIKVGGSTEVEVKERKARVEDALHATRAAVQEGIVPGGGVALLRAAKALDGLKVHGDEKIGVDIVRKALAFPAFYIAQNAGLNGTVVVEKIMAGEGDFGYDALRDKFCSLMEAGVVDPTKVVRLALQNASSVAGLLLTTAALISEIPKEEEPPAAPPPY